MTDGAYEFEIPEPGFRSLSFRSNVVFRWEWRPGSTLYLAWQRERERLEQARTPRPASFADFGRAFASPGRNLLLLKASYWFTA